MNGIDTDKRNKADETLDDLRFSAAITLLAQQHVERIAAFFCGTIKDLDALGQNDRKGFVMHIVSRVHDQLRFEVEESLLAECERLANLYYDKLRDPDAR